jgi:hypothetical protein
VAVEAAAKSHGSPWPQSPSRPKPRRSSRRRNRSQGRVPGPASRHAIIAVAAGSTAAPRILALPASLIKFIILASFCRMRYYRLCYSYIQSNPSAAPIIKGSKRKFAPKQGPPFIPVHRQ